MPIANYINEINKRFKTGISREHSYRGDLQTLIETMVSGVIATNEPARINCGAPDYVITKKDIPLGYIEAKDIDDDLDNKNHKEQFDRYRNSLNNLIITNYLEFRFYRDGEKVTAIRIGHIEKGKVFANPENFQTFNDLIVSFCAHKGQTIRSASKLAKMMAGKARLLADIIKKALDSDDDNYDNKTLQQQLQAFQKILISDITKEEFSDVYSQTIAYGMFAGRLNDSSLGSFSRTEACECIPKSNPFLRKLFGYIAGPDIDDRIKWVVDDLADIFIAVDLHDILKDFGKATKTQDPIIHFYETFLSEYDPKLRKSRGVWYTPQPVVNFIVRAVDDILKDEFGLADGLADTSKIKIKIKDTQYGNAKRGKSSAEIEKEVHRIQLLDPATGTGTFLAEVIRQIHEKFIPMQGMWQGYVENHLLPRLHGFELLMASYAMAHLKLDLMLKETGYNSTKNDRLKVYLTNSLEEPHPDTNTLFATWLSEEATEANEVKRDVPVMVVLGNPPYSVSSSNKGEWITNLCNDYKKELNERNIQPLSDDYIKFIRYGQYYVDKNGEGVLAYISNNSFLDGIIHRQMRQSLLETFDKIYIIDLHGNSRKNEVCPNGSKDENVFDIMQGVSINLFVKTGKKKNGELAKVFHSDLFGQRKFKYETLASGSLTTLEFEEINHQKPNFFFVPKNFDIMNSYNKGFSLEKLFICGNVGTATGKDDILINQNFNDLISNIDGYFNQEPNRKHIKNINYRPFDIRYIYYDNKYVQRSRGKIMKHLFNNNMGLVVTKLNRQLSNNYFFISKDITDRHILDSSGDSSNIFPLYLYEDIDNSRHPNFDKELIQKFAESIKLKFVTEKSDEEGTFAPIDVLDYIYAVLHSPKYRETYKEFLKIDFPKVPYPTDKTKFWELVKLGSQIRQIHLLESEKLNTISIGYPISGNNVVEKPKFDDGKVYINETQYFDNVPEIAWNFYIGGYQPAQKWLKDRKNKELSFDDIRHYQKIINALYLTSQLMSQIDDIGII